MGDPQPLACQRQQLGARGPECVFRTEGRGAWRGLLLSHRPSLFQQDCMRAEAGPKTQVPPGQLRVHSRFGSRPSGLLPLCMPLAQ